MSGLGLDRFTIEGVGRVYTDYNETWLPSVSTVLKMRPIPPALKRWKKNTENADEITKYKQTRGTMIHYNSLNPFDSEEMWSGEEETSSLHLRNDLDRLRRYRGEEAWAMKTWNLIKQVSQIREENVIDVETYVRNEDVGYAGQFDLLYHDPVEDHTVLADIKTGKAVYDKNLIQLTAYKHALPMTVDRMEILRMNPDYQDWEISRSDEWLEDDSDLWEEFVSLRRQLGKERLPTIVEAARRRAEENPEADVEHNDTEQLDLEELST